MFFSNPARARSRDWARRSTRHLAPYAVAIVAAATAGAAAAQSASSTASPFKGGYGGYGLSGLESPINVSTHDGNGNLIITDGVTQVGSDQSVFSRARAGGASDAFSGVGALGGATAVGNSLSVNVQGDYNTVVVNANQTNTGNITATSVLNGKVNLDGAQ